MQWSTARLSEAPLHWMSVHSPLLCCVVSRPKLKPDHPGPEGPHILHCGGKKQQNKVFNGKCFVTEGPLQIRAVSQTICNCVLLFQGCHNPVLEGRNQLGFSVLSGGKTAFAKAGGHPGERSVYSVGPEPRLDCTPGGLGFGTLGQYI